MNLPRIYERLYCSPIALSVSRFHALHAAVLPRLMGRIDTSIEMALASGLDAAFDSGQPMRAVRGAVDERGQRAQRCYPDSGGCLFREAKPGVAVVPIYGVLAKGLSAFDEDCGGGTSIEPIAKAFEQAVASTAIRAIVLDANSPGGAVEGIPELGARIRAAREIKPILAWTDTGSYSACEWLASQAGERYGTISAGFGSIGVRAGWLDETVAMEMEGLKLHLFEGGRHKGAGMPFRGMSTEEMAMLQAKVDYFYGMFKADLLAGRGAVSDDHMQGQTFTAAQAVDTNLIDGLFASWDEFIAEI